MNELFGSAALWGFVGGAGYAGTRLSTALWGGIEVSDRARALAFSQFVVALFLSPFAGYAFTPLVLVRFPGLALQPSALMIGLSFNAVWPLLVERGFLRKLVSDFARGLAEKLTPGTDA